MLKKKWNAPIHPGEHIYEDFLAPLGLSVYQFAQRLGVSQAHASELVKGKRSVTPVMALKLAKMFGTSAELWLGLQMEYEMDALKKKAASLTRKVKPITAAMRRRAEEAWG